MLINFPLSYENKIRPRPRERMSVVTKAKMILT